MSTPEPSKGLPGPNPHSSVDTSCWWRYPNLRALNLLMIIPLLSIFSQGFDGSMMNGLQSVTHWQTYFGSPTGALLGFFNAAYPLGGILGSFAISPVADTLGRRCGIAFGAALCCVGAAIQGASVNIAMFIISRVIIGSGSVVVAGVGAPYITEIKQTSSAEVSDHNMFTFLKDLGSTAGNRRRMFIMVWAAISSQMSGNAFVSYYLSPILYSVGLKSDLQQTLINATNQMLSWFTAIYFATLLAKVGRRKLFLWSLAAIWVVDICITAGSAVFAKDNTNKAAAYTVVAFLYLFSPAYNLGFNGNLGLYIPEILPYRMRTKGLSFFYFVQFCFMMLSTFTVPIGLDDITWRFYIIFVGWVMIELVGVWLVS
ncbi:hypothetical protein ACHAPM_009900 [Fusarium culmorum]